MQRNVLKTIKEVAEALHVSPSQARVYVRWVLGGTKKYEDRTYQTKGGSRRARVAVFNDQDIKSIRARMEGKD